MAIHGGWVVLHAGAAKDLPGVKELFSQSAPEPVRRTRRDMYRGIDPDYYGYRWVGRGGGGPRWPGWLEPIGR